MSTRTERLAAFLAAGAAAPFVFGRRDCAIWVADWIAAERGADPAHALRGSFSCHLGSARLVRRAGGLVALVSPWLARAGLVETAEPVLGDVGVVMTAAGELGAIRTANGWAMKTKDGIAIVQGEPLKAWSV